MMLGMRKIKIGDIFEVPTEKGLAYLHYVYMDASAGHLLRVLPGLFNETPANLEELVAAKESYWIHYPLVEAYKQNLVKTVGSYSANKFKKPKCMRSQHIIKDDFIGWHIIDTDTWQRELVENLTEAQKSLSPWGVWNHTLLVERLTTGWNLNDWQ